MALTAKDRLILVRVKIERAKKHLLEFDKVAESFEGAYSQIAVADVHPAGTIWQIYGGLPDIRTYPVASFELLAIAGDIVQNLRSALDHLAYQLAEVGSPGSTPSEWVAFPIVRDAKDYESAKARKVKGMRPEAIKAIDSLKPYQGGNEALWRLHELNNVDKHRFVFEVFPNGLFLGDGFDGHYWLKAKNPTFNGISHPQVNENIEFTTSEALSQSEIGKSKSLLEFLHESVDLVDGLVTRFEPFLA